MTSQSPTILVVCTGNVSRSPAAELLLAARLGPTVRVGSAGTAAADGLGFDPRMAALLPELPTGEFVARQLTPGLIEDANLILTMTRAHRVQVLDIVPAAVRRTFTLLDFAKWLSVAGARDVAGTTPAERLCAVLGRVPDLRARAPRHRSQPVDVPDPFGRDRGTYRDVAHKIRKATDDIADALTATPHEVVAHTHRASPS